MIMTQWMSVWVSERTRILLYSSLASFRIRYLCKRRGVCKCVPHVCGANGVYIGAFVFVFERDSMRTNSLLLFHLNIERKTEKKLSINYNTLSRIEIVTCGSARELRRWNCSDRFPVEQLFYWNVQVSINRFSMILCFVLEYSIRFRYFVLDDFVAVWYLVWDRAEFIVRHGMCTSALLRRRFSIVKLLIVCEEMWQFHFVTDTNG